jgi:peptidase S41-like protein
MHDLLIPMERCNATSAKTVTRKQALEDLAVVERILRRGYAGFDVLARAGVDWDRTFAQMRERVSSLPELVEVGRLRDWLSEQLSMTRDNHLSFFTVAPDGLWTSSSPGVHEDAYTADIPTPYTLLACKGHRLDEILRPTVAGDPPRPARRLVVLATKPPGPLECMLRRPDGATVAKSLDLRRLRVRATGESEHAPVFERHDGAVVRLRIRSLSRTNEGQMASFVATADGLRGAGAAIVLDVRGNGGGSDSFVYDWFQDLTQTKFHFSMVGDPLQSEVTRQGTVNALGCDLTEKRIDAKARASLTKERNEAVADLEQAARRVKGPYRDWKTYTPEKQQVTPAYAGALVVLADSACGSSCESILMFARQLPGALVVGENSAGAGVFGEVLEYRLPSSRIGVHAGSKWFHDTDPKKTVQEGTGYLPDIWLDTDDAPRAAEGIASCLADARCGVELRAGLAAPPDLPNPFNLVDEAFKGGNYLAALSVLREREAAYLASPLADMFLEALGTYQSQVGDERAALESFGRVEFARDGGPPAETVDPFPPPGYVWRDAVQAIRTLAAGRRAVFINEAHNVPRHRALTAQLLEALRADGFTHFAAETLNDKDTNLDARGYPLMETTGYYTDEPLYGDLVRTAHRLGFKVVAYEDTKPCADPDPWVCVNRREDTQAANLVARVVQADPTARLVVHAGYGHIDELGRPGWVPMGRRFRERAGIDPLTVDQVMMSERVPRERENPNYAAVADKLSSPVVLLGADGMPWVEPSRPGAYDVQVFTPRTRFVDGRPDWLTLGGRRRPVRPRRGLCGATRPCLIQAFSQSEGTQAVPIDQIEIRAAGAYPPLLLPKGRFLIRAVDDHLREMGRYVR